MFSASRRPRYRQLSTDSAQIQHFEPLLSAQAGEHICYGSCCTFLTPFFYEEYEEKATQVRKSCKGVQDVVKRKRLAVVVSTVLLTGLLIIGLFAATHIAVRAYASGGPVTTIKGLHTISVVGSTQTILNANGNTITVDANPYGVAIAPSTTPSSSTLNPGDIIVSNFGANGTGTSLVRFPGKTGPGQLFNTVADPGTSGPAAEAFNSIGDDWVANYSGNNVQIFTTTGSVLASISRPLFDKPWGQAFNNGTPNSLDGSLAAFFLTNAGSGTIDRLSIALTSSGVVITAYQIGKLAHASTKAVPIEAPQGMVWVPFWRWEGKTYTDVLFVTDPVNNRIAAYPNSSTRNTTSKLSTYEGMTVFQGGPLATPAGLAINPWNGDLLIVNQRNNNLVEINPSPTEDGQNQVVGVRTLDPARVNQETGANSALFGLAATLDANHNLEVYFTDDNTNTLNVLTV